eukprot:3471794-Prymnesium_polylepis.2
MLRTISYGHYGVSTFKHSTGSKELISKADLDFLHKVTSAAASNMECNERNAADFKAAVFALMIMSGLYEMTVEDVSTFQAQWDHYRAQADRVMGERWGKHRRLREAFMVFFISRRMQESKLHTAMTSFFAFAGTLRWDSNRGHAL